MDIKNRYDRLIVLFSFGILIISSTLAVSIVIYQNAQKENRQIEKQEDFISETINIKIWREYHKEQMKMLMDINNRLIKLENHQQPATIHVQEL